MKLDLQLFAGGTKWGGGGATITIYSNDGLTTLETLTLASDQGPLTVVSDGLLDANSTRLYTYSGSHTFTGFATSSNQSTPYFAVGNTVPLVWTSLYVVEQDGTPYEHILKGGNKVQVDSAIRDGNGVKIDTNYAKKSELPDISGKENTSNKVTSLSSSSTDTQYPSAKCVFDEISDVAEIAEGKTNNYVIDDTTTGTNVVNTSFNSTNNTITITITSNKIKDVLNNTINLSSLKVGDIVSVTQTSVPDRWVGSITSSEITFYKLETKLDIDSSPTSGSTNPVSSGGVYTTLGNYSLKSATVSDVTYDSSNKKLKKTINGTTTDVVTFGANAFNSTTIPTSYVSSLNGDTGAITNVAKTNVNNNFSVAQSGTSFTLSNGTPLNFTGYGTGTYNRGAFVCNTADKFGVECPRETDSASGTIVPFRIGVRGGQLGNLHTGTIKIGDNVTLSYDSTNKCLKVTF